MSVRASDRSLTSPPPLGPPPAPRVPRPERWTLANGLRVVAVPRVGVPQVVLRLGIPAGAAADPAPYFGTAALVGELLTEGTERYSAEALNERLDALGAAVSVQTGHDLVEVEATLLSETLAEALPLFADLVARPSFPVEETERVRAETLDALIARLDEPANVAEDALARAIYGEEHPYGRLCAGTEAGVATVPREALHAFHRARYRPAGSFLVAAGEFDVPELAARLEEAFAGWEGNAPAVSYPPAPTAPVHGGERLQLPWEEAAQAEIRIGGLGLPRRSPEWINAAVANYILGGSTITSRLGANLREEKGWTYGVRSAFGAHLHPGPWLAETAVDDEVSGAAVEEILGELRRMVEQPVEAEELRRAKDALILSLPRAFETPARVVSRFFVSEAFALPEDYWVRFPERVEAVTAEEVQRIARGYFDPARLVRVVVGSGPPEPDAARALPEQ